MLVAHLSDLHLRDAGDVIWLERQLDRIAERNPVHLAITGDLLDRWSPRLLRAALAALRVRGLLEGRRTTLLHGNHDLASSGGHPRRRQDLWRLVTRFWDPPPLVTARRRRFYRMIERIAPGVAAAAPFVKHADSDLRIAVIDSVPTPWRPLRIYGRRVVIRHAIGCVRPRQAEWLASLHGTSALVMLVHHYPLPVSAFCWKPERTGRLQALRWLERVEVPMEIPAADRASLWKAARHARTRLILCGHVHRAGLEVNDGIAVGLNGQSGAAWAGRTIAWYQIGTRDVKMSTESVS